MWYYIEKVGTPQWLKGNPFEAHLIRITFALLFTINRQFIRLNEEARFSVSFSRLLCEAAMAV